MSLSMALKGDNLILVNINKGLNKRKQLSDLGLIKGATFRLINCQNRGPVVIEIKGTRLAIGHALAEEIIVERCENQ